MKQIYFALSLSFSVLVLPLCAQTTVASDDGEAYSGVDFSDENQGTGFSGPFAFKLFGVDDQGGEYLENASSNGHQIEGNQSLALYANTSGTGKAVSRQFSTSLSGSHRIVFRVRFDLNTNAGKTAGIVICSTPLASQTYWNDGQRLFLGISGDSLWKYDDGTLKTVTFNNGASNFSANGGDVYEVQLDIDPGGTDTYGFKITNLTSSAVSDVMTGTLDGTANASIATIGFGNGVIGNNQNLIFDAITVTQNPTNPLPVELAVFEAVRKEAGVQLRWRTLSEKESDYFAIERMTPGTDWKEIAAVPAAGNSSVAQDYAFLDGTAPRSVLYYRLKMVEQDGAVWSYSPVRSVAAVQSEWELAPNPVHEEAVLHGLPEAGEVEVLDAQGRVVRRESFRGEVVRLDVRDLPKGTWFVRVLDAQGRNAGIRRLLVVQ